MVLDTAERMEPEDFKSAIQPVLNAVPESSILITMLLQPGCIIPLTEK
jgi:hypothetical protein